MTLPRRQLIGLAGAAMLPLRPWSQRSQLNYPTRPVRVIVTFAPGGTVDVFTRIVAQKLSERLGKQIFTSSREDPAHRVRTLCSKRSQTISLPMRTPRRMGLDGLRVKVATVCAPAGKSAVAFPRRRFAAAQR